MRPNLNHNESNIPRQQTPSLPVLAGKVRELKQSMSDLSRQIVDDLHAIEEGDIRLLNERLARLSLRLENFIAETNKRLDAIEGKINQ